MKSISSTGLYLFPKSCSNQAGLKEMLQFLRTHAPGKSVQFSYVECETALIPNLTLWENLQMVVGGQNWTEALGQMSEVSRSLATLIKDPQIQGHACSDWERFTVALIKGIHVNSQNLLINIDEEKHSSFNLAHLKKLLPELSQNQKVFLASTNSYYWLDITHGVIKKEGYKFLIEENFPAATGSRRSA